MIEKAVTTQLGGTLNRIWERDGLTVKIDCLTEKCVG